MKAEDTLVTNLLEGAKQFIVPIFPRDYSWGTKHCQQLWKDVIRVGSDPNVKSSGGRSALGGEGAFHARERLLQQAWRRGEIEPQIARPAKIAAVREADAMPFKPGGGITDLFGEPAGVYPGQKGDFRMAVR